VTYGGTNDITSNELLGALQYPDSSQQSYTYDALGDVTKLTQPSGTLHSYVYDLLGRQTSDQVANLGTGVDPSVQRIDTTYDKSDRPYLFTSYADTAGSSVVNQVEDSYNGIGQLTGEYQEQIGADNTSYSPEYVYHHNEMADGHNNSRPTSIVYQNGRQIDYVYNSLLTKGTMPAFR
jgi:YD repeat-containing protein